jgi:hypothetical protein
MSKNKKGTRKMTEQNQDGRELETPVEPLVMTGEELREALGIPEGAEIAAIPVTPNVDFKHDPDAEPIDWETHAQVMAKRIQESGIAPVELSDLALDPRIVFSEGVEVARMEAARKNGYAATIQDLLKPAMELDYTNPALAEIGIRTRFALWKLQANNFLASSESRRAENCADTLRNLCRMGVEIADAATNPEA